MTADHQPYVKQLPDGLGQPSCACGWESKKSLPVDRARRSANQHANTMTAKAGDRLRYPWSLNAELDDLERISDPAVARAAERYRAATDAHPPTRAPAIPDPPAAGTATAQQGE